MPRIRLPKDWEYKATRALNNLKKPGVAAACLWCGHRYRRDKYNPETETAHLLQCPEYPQEAKRKMLERKRTKPRPAPQVGIFYFVQKKLSIDTTPLAEAGRFGDFAIHERDHYQYWAQLLSSDAVPDAEYEKYPRGRVAYNTKTDKFTLLADQCILRKKRLVKTILSRMNLPARDTEVDKDSHYRCFHCLGRGR